MIAVMEALSASLRTVADVSVTTYPTANITPPHAIVGIPTVLDYRKARSGARLDLEVSVTLLTGAAYDETAALRLAEYASPVGSRSVYFAIERNRTLGGLVEDVHVREFRALGADEYGTIGYFGGEFTLAVMVRGDRL